MLVRMPDYYKEFTCIADKCKNNCCLGGWEIDIDEETIEEYSKVEGEFGEKLRENVQKLEEYCFRLEDGKCPFLDQQQLCQIYQQLGPGKMGRICNEFPRFLEYYGDVKEMGLGLACEEVGRILFSKIDPVNILEETCEKDTKYDTEPIDEAFAKNIFMARDYCISLLQDRSQDISMQLGKVLMFAQIVQNYINNNHYETIGELVLDEQRWVLEYVEQYQQPEEFLDRDAVNDILFDFAEFAVLEDRWQEYYDGIEAQVQQVNWLLDREDFMNSVPTIDVEYEQLLVYYSFRYFAQAIYDNNFLDKAKFMAVSFLIIREMDVYTWLSNGKHFSLEDQVEVNRIYARQMEYSEGNMQDLQDDFIFANSYNVGKLIELL